MHFSLIQVISLALAATSTFVQAQGSNDVALGKRHVVCIDLRM